MIFFLKIDTRFKTEGEIKNNSANVNCNLKFHLFVNILIQSCLFAIFLISENNTRQSLATNYEGINKK
jgi:hypothetical protein